MMKSNNELGDYMNQETPILVTAASTRRKPHLLKDAKSKGTKTIDLFSELATTVPSGVDRC